MKEDENILEKAVKALKNEQVPPGPPQALTDATNEKLAEAAGESHAEGISRQIRIIERLQIAQSLTKVAAAAVLLIVVGYAAGRLSAPQPPDAKQLCAVIEPAIRNQLLDDMKQYLQLGLANSYIRLKDDITEQYHRDLNQLAANIVTASGTVTNQLLEELIESIYTAQTQERQRVAAALEQIELNRRQENAQLSNALVNFAVQYEDQLTRTQQDMEQLRSYTHPDSSTSGRLGDSDI
jgi:hypothetical protein